MDRDNYRLYPSGIDPPQITAARVANQLSRSLPQSANEIDELTVYYSLLGKIVRGK